MHYKCSAERKEQLERENDSKTHIYEIMIFQRDV